MARMLEGMPPDSPPKLVMSILPRLQQQNDEIISLLREQSELLRQARIQPVTRESERALALTGSFARSTRRRSGGYPPAIGPHP